MQLIFIDSLQIIFYGDSHAWEPWPGLAWSRYHYNPGRPVARPRLVYFSATPNPKDWTPTDGGVLPSAT